MAASPHYTWEGVYYDGLTPQRHAVIVTITPAGLSLATSPTTAVLWPYDQVEQTQGFAPGEHVRLEHTRAPGEALVIADQAFLEELQRMVPAASRDRFEHAARRSRRTAYLAVAAVAAVVLMVGLYEWAIPALAGAAANRMPVSWEEQLGQATLAEMAPADKRCTDPARLGVLQRIMGKLTAAAPASPYTFRIYVIHAPVINAFAAPGGYIVVFDELLRQTRSPEELAGVLAHEIQHVLHRHVTRAMFRDLSVRALLTVLTSNDQTTAGVLQAAGAIDGLRFSRSAEAEADRDGMKLVQAARLDPRGMIHFFDTLKHKGVNVPGYLQFLASHPQTDDRIDELKRLAAQARYQPVPLLPGYHWRDIDSICAGV